MQRASSGQSQEAEIAEQLSKLKEDLEYVRFFPKAEKYVSLFMGGDDTDIVDRRNRLRKQIKANIIAAAASGKDLEETGSEDDGLLDLSEDDFFLTGSSSDEADADDEWTDKSARSKLPVLLVKQHLACPVMKGIRGRSLRGLLCLLLVLQQIRVQIWLMLNQETEDPQIHRLGTVVTSSNSDARKPRRKRRAEKKKQQA
ncbi:hypothetical protein LOK49_LG08G02882 [Camellia lanceoleosa]|uniref:Uncharacterized protein n=1 Tax=Camellia lanceoleosa TaxID=1840588 RepID=A0ACC0GS21_9ERIC|nr:hypothetical protein LOK49_LG08G02882 [Camellia lanceoleosa]